MKAVIKGINMDELNKEDVTINFGEDDNTAPISNHDDEFRQMNADLDEILASFK